MEPTEGGEIGVSSEWYLDEKNSSYHSRRTSEGTRLGIKKNDTKEARSRRAKLSRQVNKESYRGNGRGSKNPKAKLDENQVYEIRFSLVPKGLSNKEIAKKFSVKPYVIQFIRSGKTWKHVVCDSPAHK